MITNITSIGTDNKKVIIIITFLLSVATHKILAHGLFGHRLLGIDCHRLIDWFSNDRFH